MTVVFRPGAWRRSVAWLWLGFAAIIAAFWFGSIGPGLVCIAATGWLRRLWSMPLQRLTLRAGDIRQVWVLSRVLCVQTAAGSRWVWRDEVTAAEWAALRRYLRINLPAQPLGLTISS